MNVGKCVGAVIRDQDDNLLVQYRLREPVGLALPAGHIDDELPEEALRRELEEETGLHVRNMELVLELRIGTGCAKGHDAHDWWVYEVEVDGMPELREPQQHRFVRYMPMEEIQNYIELGDCDPTWFENILPALGIWG